MSDTLFPIVGRTKYLLRMKGGYPCGFCGSDDVVAALIDDTTNNSMAACSTHLQPDIAHEEGLRVVDFRLVDTREGP